jgi:hypothetical protein
MRSEAIIAVNMSLSVSCVVMLCGFSVHTNIPERNILPLSLGLQFEALKMKHLYLLTSPQSNTTEKPTLMIL